MSEYNATKKAMEVMNIGYDLANSEWRDKIKDKIKELKEEIEEGYLADENIRVNKAIIDVLKELLEE